MGFKVSAFMSALIGPFLNSVCEQHDFINYTRVGVPTPKVVLDFVDQWISSQLAVYDVECLIDLILR